MNLDEIDIKILRELQRDGHQTMKELGMKVNLSASPTFERVKRLEREGYISRYSAIIDPGKINRGFIVFCSVKLRQLSSDIHKEFSEMVKEMPEVTECFNVSGTMDYLLKIQVADMQSYRDFILNKLGVVPYLSSLESSFVMDSIKSSGEINF